MVELNDCENDTCIRLNVYYDRRRIVDIYYILIQKYSSVYVYAQMRW